METDAIIMPVIGLLIAFSYNSYDLWFPGVADAKSYVLISQVPADVYRKYVEDVNSAHVTGFTFVVISVVHLAGGKIPEGMSFGWIFLW